MNRLIKQLRITILLVLGTRVIGIALSIVENLPARNLRATLGDWVLTSVVLCVLAVVVHSAIYGAVHLVVRRRALAPMEAPEGRAAVDRRRGLTGQLRVSLLITLGVTAFGLVQALLDSQGSGALLIALRDWAGVTAVLCAFVAVVQTVIYTAAHVGRPEGREVRRAGAGLLIMLAIDALYAWPLWTRAVDDASRTPFRLACALLALIPALTALASWARARTRRPEPSIAWNRALLFGIVSLPLQAVVSLVFLAVA
ncbi:hypothetical protein [Streptomyces arenae]|uniref:hypothetical protein n=1 Tax=Streptomyces arenae TaxID=29301 RepID=UPI0026582636|nr:hypothetical protein [Streptomyces arenae]MCG7210447.1 AGE family epimerase/isomerase [Streptomyces arenae]